MATRVTFSAGLAFALIAGFNLPLSAEPAVSEYSTDTVIGANGVDPSKLRDAVNYAMNDAHETRGIVIIKNGETLVEAYDSEESQTGKHLSYSVAKSFTSTLVGIAIDEGHLSLDDYVCQFFDEWDCDDEDDARRHIQIRNHLTLTTGLDWHEDWSCPMNKLRLLFRNSDAVYMDIALFKTPSEYVLDRPVAYAPGEHFAYSTGDPAVFSRIIEKATGTPFLEFAKTKLFTPLGISDLEWGDDANGHIRNYSHLHLKTKDFAKLGQLFLQQGSWNGEQLVSSEWVKEATDPKSGISPWYAYLWHVDLPVKYNRPESTIPKDAIMARGIFGQWVVAIPSLGLVIAKNANNQCTLDEPLLIEKIVAAVNSQTLVAAGANND